MKFITWAVNVALLTVVIWFGAALNDRLNHFQATHRIYRVEECAVTVAWPPERVCWDTVEVRDLRSGETYRLQGR